MPHPIFRIFHQQTKTKYQKESAKPHDFKSWPKEWTTVYFKSYPRLPLISLPEIKALDFPLGKALILRRSEREFSGEPLELGELSQLLFYAAGITGKKEGDWNRSHRPYPSGGARFPLEIYLFCLKGREKLAEGIYHYNVKDHSLEQLIENAKLREEIYPEAVWQEMMLKVPLVLVISAVFERTTMKYKDRGGRYALFEAGHLGQNIYLISKALGLQCCAIGGFDDDKFHRLLDIDGEEEAIIYVFALGQ